MQIEFPKIEVRYEDLTVDAYVHVGSRALPTIPNFICNMTEVGPQLLTAKFSSLHILQRLSGTSSPCEDDSSTSFLWQWKNYCIGVTLVDLDMLILFSLIGVSEASQDLPRRKS